MIKELELKELDKVNNLLSAFNYKLSLKDFNNNKFLNVIVYDGTKGVLVYDYIYDRVEIEYIIVDNKYRGLGIATELLNYVEKKYTNLDNITLEVRESNEEALSFYKKNGFKEVSIREKYYGRENGILMMKKLGE